jgi:hypothetical protein
VAGAAAQLAVFWRPPRPAVAETATATAEGEITQDRAL